MRTSIVGNRRSSAGRADVTLRRLHAVRGSQGGFSYLMVLAAVVVVGIVVEVAHLTTWRILKADREVELLFRGEAYRRAIKSYYEAGTTLKSFPRSLEDLVKDPRFAGKRHIRALYQDPMSKDERSGWRLIRAPDGGIAGVASRSKEEPLKQANFEKQYEQFAGAKSYSDWVFEYQPAAPAAMPLPQGSRPPPVAPRLP